MEEEDRVVGNELIDSPFSDIDHLLTAKDLEEIKFDKPVFFLHDGHECVVNEEAMKRIKEEGILFESDEPFIEKYVAAQAMWSRSHSI